MDVNGAESTEELHFFYDAQSKPAFVEYDGAMYRYVHNLQGDIVAIVDTAGNLVVEYKYDAWGKLLNTTGPMADTLGKKNLFRYRSYIYDDEAQIYYLYSRCYNPALSRFLNGDIILSSGVLNGNLFQYCENNPICRGDKAGKDSYYVVLNVYDPAGWNNNHGHYDLSIISKENPEKGYTFSYGPNMDGVDTPYSDNEEYPARYMVWLEPDRGPDRKPCLRFVLYDSLSEEEYQEFKTFFFKFFTPIDEIKESTKVCRFKIPGKDYTKYCVAKLSYCAPGVSYLVSFIVRGASKLSLSVKYILDEFKTKQCDVTAEMKETLCNNLPLYNP